jgi:hypothetical protein
MTEMGLQLSEDGIDSGFIDPVKHRRATSPPIHR